MIRQRRKTDIKAEVFFPESDNFVDSNFQNALLRNSASGSLRDYFKFAIYCLLLAVPLYAITVSILKNDWIMVIIDALIVPVGFVHGLLLLFGYVV